MDERLVAWARAVKARRARLGRHTPVLWMFTDAQLAGNPLAVAGRLPAGLCGVVFRHDGVPDRDALAASMAALCRRRRVVLSIAGDWRLAARLGAWVHLRGGLGRRPAGMPCSASAHNRVELRRARLRGAVVFLSPVFPTASHEDGRALGVVRWAALAVRHGHVLALGGVDGRSARRLPRWIGGAGAIRALGAHAVKG